EGAARGRGAQRRSSSPGRASQVETDHRRDAREGSLYARVNPPPIHGEVPPERAEGPVQNPSGSKRRDAASSASVGADVSLTSSATFKSQPVLARTSSTVWPGCTEARCASPPPSENRSTQSVVMIATGPPPSKRLRFRHPG